MPDATPPSQRLKLAVVGLGGIGGALAMALRVADRHDVVACPRRPLERLVLEWNDVTLDLPLNLATDPGAVGPADWVMLCTKAHHTPQAAPWLASLCRPGTRVAVLQNGMDHVARTAPYANGATVMPVIVYYNGERLAPDRVRLRQVAGHDLVVANDADGRDFARVFDGSGLRVLCTDDFKTRAWRKLLLNIVVNPVTALTLQRQAVIRRPDVHALCLDILAEAVAVARADGARLADDEPARVMNGLLSAPEGLGTSMYFDRLAGQTLEIEALTGALVAAADRYGLPVPLNRTLLVLCRAVSEAAAG
jgi:2-dehydropantoate 2-reductase